MAFPKNVPMSVRSVSILVVVLLVAGGVAAWFYWSDLASEAQPRAEASAVARRSAPEAVTAAELVRVYQGPVHQKDGGKVWLLVHIRTAEQRGDEIAFRYFMSSPTQTTSGDGLVDAEGHIRFDGFRGRVVQQRGTVVLQSIGIDGPPYWRLVGRAGKAS